MRYELTDYEWAVIKPMLHNKPRGVPRVNDRRVLNGIFWVLRSGAPWRDLPQEFGPYVLQQRTVPKESFFSRNKHRMAMRVIKLREAEEPAPETVQESTLAEQAT
jgi:transposase